MVLDGVARVPGKRQHQAPAFSVAELKQAIRGIATEAGQSNKALKNQTKQKTDAMSERYACLAAVKPFNVAHYLGL